MRRLEKRGTGKNLAGVALAVAALAVFQPGACGAGEKKAPLPIIPGAHGFGLETPAGSGRNLNPPKTRVIKVTNLNAKGPGSLREAVEAKGPRVVVFEVSGNIDFSPFITLQIKNPYITIAGQTAPSPGITLKACQLDIRAHDVLLQHIRVRTGDLLDPTRPARDPKSGWTQWSERDCMKVGGRRTIIDHCSFSWASDETVQSTNNDLTFSHNIFGEALDHGKHHKGGHGRGLLIINQGSKNREQGQNVAIIGNLFVHSKGRNAKCGGPCTVVAANNLIYNANFAMKAEEKGTRTGKLFGGYTYFSIVGNVMKKVRHPVVMYLRDPGSKIYVAPDNIFNGKTFDPNSAGWKKEIWQRKYVLQPFGTIANEKQMASVAPITIPGYKIKPASKVEQWVLATAGARPVDRDPVDKRDVNDVRKGTGKMVNSQEDVGGWPELKENHRKLKLPRNPNGDDDGDGYTNLEEWLHEFAAKVEGRGK